MLLDNHRNWIRSRELAVAQTSATLSEASFPQPVEVASGSSMPTKLNQDPSELPVQPLEADVLMGRGRRVQSHAENNKLRSILEESLAVYMEAPHATKRHVAMAVVQVKNRGGRFLRPTGGECWEVADEESIQKKVLHDFRTIKGILKKQRVEGPSPA
jgi:hypothetical protein